MSTYTPDAWIAIDLTTKTDSVRKILAGWYGGYLDGDSWKLSSGVTATTEYHRRYEFTNASGSLYICYKTAQRLTGLTGSMLHSWQQQAAESNVEGGDPITVEVVHFPE